LCQLTTPSALNSFKKHPCRELADHQNQLQARTRHADEKLAQLTFIEHFEIDLGKDDCLSRLPLEGYTDSARMAPFRNIGCPAPSYSPVKDINVSAPKASRCSRADFSRPQYETRAMSPSLNPPCLHSVIACLVCSYIFCVSPAA